MTAALMLMIGVSGCNPNPDPVARARHLWLQQLKADDPEAAQALARECADEQGGFSFSPKQAAKITDCMKEKRDGQPADWSSAPVQ